MMENKKDDRQNEKGTPSEWASTPKAKPQGENFEVKEGDPTQQRPMYGAEGGINTSSREKQLPTIADRMAKGNDTDSDERGK